jgi:ferredoxin
VLAALLSIAVALTIWRALPYARVLAAAAPASRSGNVGRRLSGVLEAVGLHRRLLQRPFSGVLHALIFCSFFVLFTAIVDAFGSGFFPGFSLRDFGGDTWIGLLQDVFAVLMSVGVGMAIYQRFVLRPKRFEGSNQVDAVVIYVLIEAIVLSMLMQAAFTILGGAPSGWRPVSGLLAYAIAPFGIPVGAGESFSYWAHVTAILCFLIYIPGSKHRHMFLAAPNVYLRSLAPKGLAPEPPASPKPDSLIDPSFDRKQILDLLACTECGRCQAVCPAYASGLPLSPKTLIMDLRDALPVNGALESFPGQAISDATIWSCTTCYACMEVCPVHIEHVPKIIQLRRDAIEEDRIPGACRTRSRISGVLAIPWVSPQRRGPAGPKICPSGSRTRVKARWMCCGLWETTPPTTHAPWKSAAGWPRSFTQRASTSEFSTTLSRTAATTCADAERKVFSDRLPSRTSQRSGRALSAGC